MSIPVGINGLGRVGKLVLQAMFEHQEDFEILGVNDLADATVLAHLLKYDSCHGRFPGEVKAEGNALMVNGQKIPVFSAKNPADLPWAKLGVEIVAECTGIFRKKEGGGKPGYDTHLKAGAKKVLLSAPADDDIDATIVLGVNDEALTPAHRCFSNASCTTNCLAPAVKIVHEAFGVREGLMTTVHAFTNDQRICDQIHKDLRRARCASQNIIPTTTGAAKAVGEVIPALKGKLNGIALRVPVPDGSIVDFTANLEQDASLDQVHQAFQAAAGGPMKGIVQYCEDPIVSTDVIHNSHSCIYDKPATMMMGRRMLKVIAWYDNEWAYACRMCDLIALAHKVG